MRLFLASLAIVAAGAAAPSGAGVATTAADTTRYRDVTIPAGTRLSVRLTSTVSSTGSRLEQPVGATLVSPVTIHGTRVLPAGSHVAGYVSSVRRSGKVKGRAHVGVRFTKVTRAGTGETYAIAAATERTAPATKAADTAKIGIPAAGGAVIGGLVGGKKGAAAGAAVGGGAGTAVVLSTRGREVALPRGSLISLRLSRPVVIRVPVG